MESSRYRTGSSTMVEMTVSSIIIYFMLIKYLRHSLCKFIITSSAHGGVITVFRTVYSTRIAYRQQSQSSANESPRTP
jgi:cytochrome c oxidase subunit IV